METSHQSENLPPSKSTKKLKQATLSFFKSSPKVNPKTPTDSKKRKHSSPAPDSPNKIAKLSKPLVAVVDPPNSPSKQSKSVKNANVPEPIINDHEVSSSSEADSGSSKASSGKCCLMERFVCKLPKGGNQEISSTNDVDNKIVNRVDTVPSIKDENAEDDIIILDDCGKDEDDMVDKDKTEHQIIATDNPKDKEDPEKDARLKGADASGEETCSESETVMGNLTNEKALKSGTETLFTPNKGQASNSESLEMSLNESSFLSSTESTSTPCKEIDVSFDSSVQNTPSSSTPKTPASKKKGPKIDWAKKAEREAQKQKQKEEKEQMRLEKKRKLEAAKAEKEKIKKEKKEVKEKEKQQQQEKLLKEKEEKERLKEVEKQKKEEEKKKKEEERLQKEEERKKKQAALEAKQEEKRLKEEEKRLKEEEKRKEEEEKQKKAEMAKLAFQNFFIKPKENVEKPATPKTNQGQFVPFQVKKDMYLAPATRRDTLSADDKLSVDKVLENPSISMATYLDELKSGKTKPIRSGRVIRTNPQPSEDCEVVHDPEALKKVIHKVKLLQFHTDYRPPYYGTWRKAPTLSAKNPWKKDEAMFDYEVDSDDEWEEEEPGESLSCSDGEEDKGEKGEEEENDEEEDGWMVPHGYLSEDEGCNEDDEITPEKLKLQQLAKAKAWEEEQKRKLQAAPLIAIGCFFEHSPSPLMTGDVRLLYEFRGVVLYPSVPIPTSLSGSLEQDAEEPTTPDKNVTTPSQRGCVKKAVPDEAMPDLIRLVHGNTSGIKRLIREFRVFWFKKESANSSDEPSTPKGKLDKSMQETDGEVSFADEPLQESVADGDGKKDEESSVKEKRDEGAKCSISKRQLDIKINAIAVREKRQALKTCWYVHDAILKEFDLEGLVCNSLVQPEPVAVLETTKETAPVRDQRSIMDFALSKEECAKREALLPKEVENIRAKKTDQKPLSNMVLPKEELAKQAINPKEDKLPRPTLQNTPKDNKKGGQMSITDFAKTGQAKKSNFKEKEVSKPILMDVDDGDVIIIESTSDIQKSSASSVCKKSDNVVIPLSTSNNGPSSSTSTCKTIVDQGAVPLLASWSGASTTTPPQALCNQEGSTRVNLALRKEAFKMNECFVRLQKFKYDDK